MSSSFYLQQVLSLRWKCNLRSYILANFLCKLLTSVARFTGALVAVDFVDAGPIVTGIALAVVDIDFTVDSYEKINFIDQPQLSVTLVFYSPLRFCAHHLWCPWDSCRCRRSPGPGRCLRFCTAGSDTH